jgi:hypothetical protein
MSVCGIGGTGMFLSGIFSRAKMKNFIISVIKSARPVVELPVQGTSVSVETALNSRCTSDSDGDPEKVHWGMFNRAKKLSSEQVDMVLTSATIPRFTNNVVEKEAKGNILAFKIQKHKSDIVNDYIMVESGMQQQAVGLVCAALGIGSRFDNLGRNGTSLSETEIATTKIRLGAMKPSYNGSWWSSLPPSGRAPWQKGNLPDPIREGANSLISTLSSLETPNKGKNILSEKAISQLLWSARGRTPHFYLSRPWGMTIPVEFGGQDISSVYLYQANKLYKYINWEHERPTHSIQELNQVDEQHSNEVSKLIAPNDAFIILEANEKFARCIWEIGYQLLNLMLQAKTLDIDYSAILLDETQRSIIASLGVKNPIAILAV